MTSTITKLGNSRGIRLPKPYLENLGIKENDTVDISLEGDTIIIKKSTKKKRKTIEQRFEEFYGVDFETAVRENPYDFEEIDWGPPVGDEIW
jgi:antitoxin MazE